MTTLPRLPVTKKLLAVFAAGFGTDKPVGLATVPKIPIGGHSGRLQLAEAPYEILYPLWTNTSGPDFAAPDADSEFVYQLSLFSERADQLEWMYDRARSLILDRASGGGFVTPIVIPGMHVMDRSAKDDVGVEPSGSGSLMDMAFRFGILVTPSSDT